ncbi:MAG: Spy/CpxP family protein refolding chaperone [Anaeromyxobacteraceae bacterium]
MKKILLSTLAVLALATAALGLTAFRHGGHGDPARMQQFIDNRLSSMLDEIKATDAQRQQITAIKDKLVADHKALRASHADVKKELLAQWQADKADAAKVHAIVDDRANGMKSFADEVADALIQVHDILTPDQRAQVATKVQSHHGHE